MILGITRFYRNHLEETDLSDYVLGLSGGLDSSIVATLIAHAVGKDQVTGLLMPSIVTSDDDLRDARELASLIGIKVVEHVAFPDKMEEVINLLEGLSQTKGTDQSALRKGNMYARVRMIILRDYAKAQNALVAGTGNASELHLGYSTMAGDGLGGIDNLGLYYIFKSQESAIAQYLNIPDNIIEKAPSAGLWKGQTDASELGGAYEHIDQIILGRLLGFLADELEELLKPYAISQDLIQSTYKRIERNVFKSQLPKHP